MPVHPKCPGLHGHVYCNGSALAEFDPSADEVSKPLTMVKYIIPQDDAEYLIYIRFDELFTSESGVEADSYVDGSYCSSDSAKTPCSNVVWELRRFRFAKVSTAEDGSSELTPEFRRQLDSLGTIRVVLRWFAKTGSKPYTGHLNSRFIPVDDLPKNAIVGNFSSYQTGLGEPESASPRGVRYKLDQTESDPKSETIIMPEPKDDVVIDLVSDDEAADEQMPENRIVVVVSSDEESDRDERVEYEQGQQEEDEIVVNQRLRRSLRLVATNDALK
ncbi:hypothetical protein T440DRAFT_493182 [Plenodomus tracheiphilus IPT5]|uniref:DUF7918 domain-containing protein n=1 Tax=Plenodomus tracheiphilus IPT5 TaxID=1408161 RepID=A0A6A7ARL0_9PLEO|nr:hypothetical protein T440DRAFT_493182 [Plenodomus tracheiphilus IPT5]